MLIRRQVSIQGFPSAALVLQYWLEHLEESVGLFAEIFCRRHHWTNLGRSAFGSGG